MNLSIFRLSHAGPRFETRVKMLWDDDYFYFSAELKEPHLWVTKRERKAVNFVDNNFDAFTYSAGRKLKNYRNQGQ